MRLLITLEVACRRVLWTHAIWYKTETKGRFPISAIVYVMLNWGVARYDGIEWVRDLHFFRFIVGQQGVLPGRGAGDH